VLSNYNLSYQIGTRDPLPGGTEDRTVNLTVYFHLVVRLVMWHALPANPTRVQRVAHEHIAT
jgi:hypothetical protein